MIGNYISVKRGDSMGTHRSTWTNMDSPDGTRKQANANKQKDRKSLEIRASGMIGMTCMETHLIKIMSTAWRKRSQVLYSSGSSCEDEVNQGSI